MMEDVSTKACSKGQACSAWREITRACAGNARPEHWQIRQGSWLSMAVVGVLRPAGSLALLAMGDLPHAADRHSRRP